MRRIVSWVLATLGGLVLLLSYKTSTDAVGPQTVPLADAAVQTQSQPQAEPQAPQDQVQPQAPQDQPQQSSSDLKDGSYTGASTDTRFGPVQVQVTVSGGVVTAATATVYPTESFRDQQINAYAIPVLQQESVGTTDGNLDMVSGATFTSMGYVGSLQDALDQARA